MTVLQRAFFQVLFVYISFRQTQGHCRQRYNHMCLFARRPYHKHGSLAGKRVVGPVIEVERAARFAAVGAVDRDPESGLGREPRLPRSGGLYLDGAGACVAGDEDFAADAFRADSRLRFILAAPPPEQ